MNLEKKIEAISKRAEFWETSLQDKRTDYQNTQDDHKREKILHEIEKCNCRVVELKEAVKLLTDQQTILY